MNLYLCLAGVALAVAAWFYRGYFDAHETELALARVAIESQRKLDAAQVKADRDTRALQAAAQVSGDRLQAQLTQSRADYDVEKLQAKLAGVPHCPIPAADVGVLFAPGREGGGASRPAAGPGPGDAPSGVVDAAEIALNAEVNRGAFERNLDRLAECVGAYDRARAAVNTP